jgi:hypothetical protein
MLEVSSLMRGMLEVEPAARARAAAAATPSGAERTTA